MIRDVCPDDVPWILDLTRYRYADYDPAAVEAILPRLSELPRPFLFIRNDHAALIADPMVYWWRPSVVEVHVVFVAAFPAPGLPGLQLVRRAVEWALEQGASKFHLSSGTGIDMSPIAAAIGAERADPAFFVDLTKPC